MNFLWGVATSSHQIEGHNKHNDWWAWEAEGNIDGGVRSGAATDHVHRFREDLALAKSLGVTSYRFSFEWSRFEPAQGEWKEDAVRWYSALLDECESLGLVPMATLSHFTLPKWLADKGGFSSDDSVEAFALFTRKIAQTFGSRIPLWCTINEPMVLVSGAYLGRFMPPGEHRPKLASKACHNLLKAHVLAYDILKCGIKLRTGPFKDMPLMVGFAHNMLDFKPERKLHPIERALAPIFSRVYNDAWLEAVNGEKQNFGCLGVFPKAKEVKIARGRKTYDFIGLNYYTKAYIQWRPRTQSKERDPKIPIGLSFARRKETASDLGWAIHPKGLTKMLEKLRRFSCPIFITENGIADADDALRSTYLETHIERVKLAKESGLDIRGYYHWSLIDNFEWVKGFWPRFGLFSVDYETFERKARPSAKIYASLIALTFASRKPAKENLNQEVVGANRPPAAALTQP